VIRFCWFPFFVGLLANSFCLVSPVLADENAVHAKCQIDLRLVQAMHESLGKNDTGASLSSDENEQLEGLPFGSYKTVDIKSAKTSSFTPVSFELAAEDENNKKLQFIVSVNPHSLADNKVHYTLEWSTTGEKSVVATRLGVENGRSIMIGADLSSELGKKKAKNSSCFIIGVKVTCHG